jgi:hypothetical protein
VPNRQGRFEQLLRLDKTGRKLVQIRSFDKDARER